MQVKRIPFFLFTLLLSYQATAQSKYTEPKIPLVLKYSFFDSPFTVHAGKTVNCTLANPDAHVSLINGMQYQSPEQALQLSSNTSQGIKWGIMQMSVFNNRPYLKHLYRSILSGAVDVISIEMPYMPIGWLHEEGHRSIMVSNYINSYNPMTFNKKSDALPGAVSAILDENLVRMKAENNANFVRLSTAGGEMQISSVRQMQRDQFFYQQNLYNGVLYLLNGLTVYGYMDMCSNKEESTKHTLELMEKEKGNQSLRDFTGLDFSAWAYDLWNPDEPYAARGQNKYGNGFDRYIYGDKLKPEQYNWLKKQAALSWANLISPAMLGIPSITLKKYADGSRLQANFSGRYYPTSFGNMIGIDLLFKTPKYNIFIAPHINQNFDNNFPGIEAMLFEKPTKIGSHSFLTTLRGITAIQPRDQAFKTSAGQFVGLLGAEVSWKASKVFYPYIAVETKTKGWVASNPYLGSNFGVKCGLSARFHYN